jgi:uncharacterized protein (DUF952 family)
MIFHFIHLHEWYLAKELNRYEPHSIATDGFIHCCTEIQINELAIRLYKGQNDLLLLEIDTNSVKIPLIYEDLYELNQLFPHLYGALNLDAINEIYHVLSIVDGKVVLKVFSTK